MCWTSNSKSSLVNFQAIHLCISYNFCSHSAVYCWKNARQSARYIDYECLVIMLICLLIVKQLWIWAASFSFTHLLALKAEWNEKKRYENDTKDSYVEITFKFTESTSFKCSWKKTTKYELQVKKNTVFELNCWHLITSKVIQKVNIIPSFHTKKKLNAHRHLDEVSWTTTTAKI